MHRFATTFTCLMMALAVPSLAAAQNQLGGHFGAVLPLVSRTGGSTTTIADQFEIGFPTGVTVKTASDWAYDLELVPGISRNRSVSLTVHPGVIRALPNAFAAGLRMAFDVRGSAWGFTPLLNRGVRVGATTYFVEGVVPIRFKQDGAGRDQTSIGFGVHVGIGF
jgi:hypothetical protein